MTLALLLVATTVTTIIPNQRIVNNKFNKTQINFIDTIAFTLILLMIVILIVKKIRIFVRLLFFALLHESGYKSIL